MTQPAITLPGQQANLAVAIAIGKMQAYVTEPLDPTLCTEVLTLENKQFATADPTIQDIISCDGRNLTDRIIREWRGAWNMELFVSSRWLGYLLAMAWGSASSASVVAQSNAVFTETVTATGGTRRLRFDNKPTDALAYNASSGTIQTAVDAIIGAGKITVGGSGPYTYTAAGAWLNTEVRTPSVSTLKLTGGTSTIAVTTPGGPARSSYTITQAAGDQPPSTTMILGYTGSTAWLISDLTVDTLRFTREDVGLYRVNVGWMWSGYFQKLGSFSWPACATAKRLETRDGGITVGGVDHGLDLRALEYTFGNRLQPIYSDVSKLPQALVRQYPLQNEWTTAFEEDPSAGTSIYGQVVANGQDGTKGVAVLARAGTPSDGAVLSSPETWVHLNSTVQEYGGTPARARVPAAFDSFNSDSNSAKPVSATIITDYSGGYLAAA